MANRNDRLGYDIKCREDIDRAGRSSSGVELVLDGIYRRLTTDQLPLIGSDDDFVDFGDDVQRWLGAATSEEELIARAATLGSVVERDERIEAADVTVESGAANAAGLISFALAIEAKLVTGTNISARVGVSVAGVTVEMLSQGR